MTLQLQSTTAGQQHSLLTCHTRLSASGSSLAGQTAVMQMREVREGCRAWHELVLAAGERRACVTATMHVSIHSPKAVLTLRHSHLALLLPPTHDTPAGVTRSVGLQLPPQLGWARLPIGRHPQLRSVLQQQPVGAEPHASARS